MLRLPRPPSRSRVPITTARWRFRHLFFVLVLESILFFTARETASLSRVFAKASFPLRPTRLSGCARVVVISLSLVSVLRHLSPSLCAPCCEITTFATPNVFASTPYSYFMFIIVVFVRVLLVCFQPLRHRLLAIAVFSMALHRVCPMLLKNRLSSYLCFLDYSRAVSTLHCQPVTIGCHFPTLAGRHLPGYWSGSNLLGILQVYLHSMFIALLSVVSSVIIVCLPHSVYSLSSRTTFGVFLFI